MNVPPTPSQLERVEEWAHQMDHFLEGCPIQFEHQTNDSDGLPCHTWLGKHGTIPARAISLQFGIPEHEEGCECVTPPPAVLHIDVIDLDTEKRVPDAGTVELINPSDSVFFSIALATVGIFHMVGTV